MQDSMLDEILNILNSANEPLETKEIEEKLKETARDETVTRIKIFYRLNLLRGESKSKGKFTGPGKGVWIWWSADAFTKK